MYYNPRWGAILLAGIPLIGKKQDPRALRYDSQMMNVMRNFICGTFFSLSSVLYEEGQRLQVIAAGTSGRGIMGIIGESRMANTARDNDRGDFMLIGVVPKEDVWWGGYNGDVMIRMIREQDLAYLRGHRVSSAHGTPYASQLVITQNTHTDDDPLGTWKTTSDVLCKIGDRLVNRRRQVTLVMNGGEGVAYELPQKLAQNTRVIVVKGTGRFSDAIAAWCEGNESALTQQQREQLAIFKEEIKGHEDEYMARIEIFDLFSYPNLEQSISALSKAILADVA